MLTLQNLIYYMIILCNTAAGVRVLYCLIRIKADPDEVSSYTKKITNLFIFLVLANLALSLLYMTLDYFT